MKTKSEIQEEINFQKSEYDRISKMTENNEWRKNKGVALVRSYYEVMSRHASRIQALEWVITDE